MAMGPGMSFSPIPTEKTLEDLPAMLARIFGGPGGGLMSKLPGVNVKGAPPDEILKAFLAGLPGGGTRPDIGEVIAPERPIMPGGPDVGVGPEPSPPQAYAPSPAAGAPEVGGPEPLPGGETPAEPPFPGDFSEVAAPMPGPSLNEPGIPTDESAPELTGELSPEEKEFLDAIMGGLPGGAPPAI